MNPEADSQVELEQPRELQSNACVFSIASLSQIPRGCLLPLSKQQISKNNRIEAFLELVTKQEKKCKGRLSPHSNFYQQHLML